MSTDGTIPRPSSMWSLKFSPSSVRQMSARAKWTGMRQTLKPGGLLILQGYTPKQIEYATGGPKQIQNLYSRKMLEEAFSDFDDLRIVEEEREINEGRSHAGMSALVGLRAANPKRPSPSV